MIFHIIRKLVDMYSRSVTNYDEYNFKKPRRSDYSNDVDTDTDDDDDDDDDGDDDNNNNCTTSDDILNHSLNNNSSESFRSIKPYNNNNKSVLGKSKF